MEPYLNLERNFGVVTYQIGATFVRRKFNSGKIFFYSSTKPGATIVSEMKKLAASGKGLESYIRKSVGESYLSWQ